MAVWYELPNDCTTLPGEHAAQAAYEVEAWDSDPRQQGPPVNLQMPTKARLSLCINLEFVPHLAVPSYTRLGVPDTDKFPLCQNVLPSYKIPLPADGLIVVMFW